MTYQPFKEMRLARLARVPHSYRKNVRWVPQIGDIFPDLQVETTQGPIDFHDWAEGRWVVLFSHPAPFTPVCTTEIAAMASRLEEFAERGVRLLGISTGTLDEQRAWHADIRRLYGVDVDFPMVADEEGLLAELFGMIHANQSPDWTIRKTFILSPNLRVRMMVEYPILVARSIDELLRSIDALQTVEHFNVGIGADWQKGDDCLLLPPMFGPPRFEFGGAWRQVCSYLRTVTDPWRCQETMEESPLPLLPPAIGRD